MVEAIELERLHQPCDILPGSSSPRLVRTVKNPGHHNSGQNAQNNHDHHYFDQGKTVLAATASRPRLDACDIHIHILDDPHLSRSVDTAATGHDKSAQPLW